MTSRFPSGARARGRGAGKMEPGRALGAVDEYRIVNRFVISTALSGGPTAGDSYLSGLRVTD